jgi:hypothetical protein
VPEEAGADVVVLDASSVLMSKRAPATRALFESRGLRVVAADTGGWIVSIGVLVAWDGRAGNSRHAATRTR